MTDVVDEITVSPPLVKDVAAQTGVFVARTLFRIQNGYLADPPTSASRAALARLRRGVGKSPAECPDLAEFYVDPDSSESTFATRIGSDHVMRGEWAAHAATSLFAVHQQSRARRMYEPHVPFGRAAGRLWRVRGEDDGVLRRFQALSTAIDLGELTQHARTLVQLMRVGNVAFDYAAFASDLVVFQTPWGADRVRFRWGRDFYTARSFDASDDENAANNDA